MTRSLRCLLAALFVVSLAAPASAADRWGSPQMTHTVSSGDLGPAHEVVVRGKWPLGRVVFEFRTLTRWWGERKLVFHGEEGTEEFRAHYYVSTPDGWSLITPEITSERGYVFGRVRSVADVTIRLVVAVNTPHRWHTAYRHRFPVIAGAPDGRAKIATAIVRTSV